MHRYLVVANRTLVDEALLTVLAERARAEGTEFHVVVPATPLDADAVRTPGPAPAERAYALARQRLDAALVRMADLGVPVDGEVGDADPVVAVRLALKRFPADEVVVSTLPHGLSRWLGADLPKRVGKVTGLPVVHVTARRPTGR